MNEDEIEEIRITPIVQNFPIFKLNMGLELCESRILSH